jgi:hypothetical protein
MLRALYERAVTLLYLQAHSEHVDDFLDYDIVTKHKLERKLERQAIQFPA